MQYYRAIIKSIKPTSDNNINCDLSLDYFFVSESDNLRYLRRLVRKLNVSNNGSLGHFAILLSYDPYTDWYTFLDAFPILAV